MNDFSEENDTPRQRIEGYNDEESMCNTHHEGMG
jgi:hypothetical protein